MPKAELVNDGQGAMLPLRVTRYPGRQVSERKIENSRTWVKCGCGPGCKQKLLIHSEFAPTGNIHADSVEINGVIGTVHQWQQIFSRLLFPNVIRHVYAEVTEVRKEEEGYSVWLADGTHFRLSPSVKPQITQIKKGFSLLIDFSLWDTPKLERAHVVVFHEGRPTVSFWIGKLCEVYSPAIA